MPLPQPGKERPPHAAGLFPAQTPLETRVGPDPSRVPPTSPLQVPKSPLNPHRSPRFPPRSRAAALRQKHTISEQDSPGRKSDLFFFFPRTSDIFFSRENNNSNKTNSCPRWGSAGLAARQRSGRGARTSPRAHRIKPRIFPSAQLAPLPSRSPAPRAFAVRVGFASPNTALRSVCTYNKTKPYGPSRQAGLLALPGAMSTRGGSMGTPPDPALGRETSEVSGLSPNCSRAPPSPPPPPRGSEDAVPAAAGDGGAGGCSRGCRPPLPGAARNPAEGSGAHRAGPGRAEPANGPCGAQLRAPENRQPRYNML